MAYLWKQKKKKDRKMNSVTLQNGSKTGYNFISNYYYYYYFLISLSLFKIEN